MPSRLALLPRLLSHARIVATSSRTITGILSAVSRGNKRAKRQNDGLSCPPMTARWVAAASVLGAVVVAAAQPPPALILSQLSWYSRSGMPLEKVGPVADHGNFEISPDGSKVAVAVVDQSTRTRDLWIYEVKGGTRTRFTTDTAEENWM